MSTLKVTNIESPSGGGVNAKITDINGGPLSNRRININGAMQVAQRGTVVNAGNEYGGPDRHQLSKNEGAYTISQATDAPAGSGFSNSFKIDVTSAGSDSTAGNYVALEHKIEGQDLQLLKKGTSSAEKLTVQFWIKTTITGTYVLEFRDTDNTRVICKTYTVSSSNTWEKKTLTFDGDTTGTLSNDNTEAVSLQWWLLAGSTYSGGTLQTTWAATTNANRAVGQVNAVNSTSNEIYFTGIQLEVGEVATAFEHRSFGDELAKCMRYFQKSYSYSDAPGAATSTGTAWMTVVQGGGRLAHTAYLKERMRATPTFKTYDWDGNIDKIRTNSGNNQSASAIYSSENAVIVDVNVAGVTENIFQYTAEAEL